ncbi:MAG: PaaI family thioesterase [Bacteroidetes bacterium]|nr:PaaI family thioesterase [Bacteroidota bacterium]
MTIEEINKLCRGTFMDLLKIEFTAYSEDHVEAVMKITPELYQPAGTVHGGALISLAESVGSAGSFLLVDPEKFQVYGSVVNSQHLTPATKGTLHAVARIVARADFKHVWDVEIKDDDGKIISISRVTNSVKPKQNKAV